MPMRTRPATLVITAVLALLPAPAHAETVPPNDEVGTPAVLEFEQFPLEDQSTAGATHDEGDPECFIAGYTVWYSFTAPSAGTLRVSATASVTGLDPFEDPERDISSAVAVLTSEQVELGCATSEFLGSAAVDVVVTAGQELLVAAGSTQPQSERTELNLDARYLAAPTLVVERLGSVTKDGTATVHATLRCDFAAEVTLTTVLEQRGRQAPAGLDVRSAQCTPGGAPVSVAVSSSGGVLHPGLADYTVTVGNGDGEPTTASGTVLLRPV